MHLSFLNTEIAVFQEIGFSINGPATSLQSVFLLLLATRWVILISIINWCSFTNALWIDCSRAIKFIIATFNRLMNVWIALWILCLLEILIVTTQGHLFTFGRSLKRLLFDWGAKDRFRKQRRLFSLHRFYTDSANFLVHNVILLQNWISTDGAATVGFGIELWRGGIWVFTIFGVILRWIFVSSHDICWFRRILISEIVLRNSVIFNLRHRINRLLKRRNTILHMLIS